VAGQLLRTYSAKGVTNVAPSLAEFQRLIVFIHLQPVYDGRLWVRVDGDEPGKEVIAGLREKFLVMKKMPLTPSMRTTSNCIIRLGLMKTLGGFWQFRTKIFGVRRKSFY
jgi:hypothetical protein